MSDTFLHEVVLRIEDGDFVCRIWRADDSFMLGNADLMGIARLAMRNVSPKSAVDQIIIFEGVNSVEVTHASGVGVCVHKNWP